MVWIGKGRGGDPIALSLLPDFFGQVFFIDHEVMPGRDTEEGAVAKPMDVALEDGVAIPLAASFSAFIVGMRPRD